MEENIPQNGHMILKYLSKIPQKMVSVHGIENTPEFVLHELCNENCFNIVRAAYFVDNPDFDHLKGVAGFCATEAYTDHDTMWHEPDTFTLYMRSCPFNQTVRSCNKQSIRKNGHVRDTVVQDIADNLGFSKPDLLEWKLKHDNHGLLLYDAQNFDNKVMHEYLQNGVHLLSFCPVF